MAVTIPGYERFREIGSGGFSRVYEAYEKEFNRRVAVKVLNVEANTGFDRVAFEDECRSMGMVSEHPNIVTVFAGGFTSEGAPYIAMERYHETLLDRIKARTFLPAEEVLELGVKMAGALHGAHQAGLLHRDIKPQNIFFSRYGEPVLGDFGIAALTGHHDAGARVGFTPSYVAPEIIEGLPATVESDLYSLGATLYTALAGRRPFSRADGEANEQLYNRIRSDPPPSISAQQLPDPLDRLIFGLLVKHPTDRPRQALDAGGLLRDAQVQLGLPATPLVLPSTNAADLDLTVTVTRAGAGLAPDREDLTSTTVIAPGRAQEDDDPEPVDDRGNRTLMALGGFVVIMLVAAAGIWLSLGPREDPSGAEPVLDTNSTTTLVLLDESPLDAPEQPLILLAGPNSIEISWFEVAGATRYRINFLSEDRPDELVDAPPLVLPTDSVQQPICIQVRAVGEGGQLSPSSTQACSSGT